MYIIINRLKAINNNKLQGDKIMGKYNYGNAIMKIYNVDKNLNENVERIKKNGTYREYLSCIAVMCSKRLFENELQKSYGIVDVNDLISESKFPILLIKNEKYLENNFYKDFCFMQAYFEVNKKYVIEFLQLKDKFEHEFLNGKREEADCTLSLIQQMFGLSFWLVESKLLLYNEWDYKKYTDYYVKIRDSCRNELLKNHIRMIKRKINLRTRTRDYEAFFLENIEGYCHCDEWTYKMYGNYSRFMLFETYQKLGDDMKKSLGVMLYHLSFVDSWILFKKLIIYLNLLENTKYTGQLFEKYERLFFPEDEKRGYIYHEIKKEFCETNYEDCAKECEQKLKDHGNYFEILDIYIKCLVLLERNRTVQSDDAPLLKLSDILIKCYIKEDDSDYASTYIDYCDRYSRALSMFSSYYELLGAVENTMEPWNEKAKWSFYVKLYDRHFLNEEAICIQYDKKSYMTRLTKNWDILYTCEWNYEYRKKLCSEGYQSDSVLKGLNRIDQDRKYDVYWENKMSNLDKIYYEEYVVSSFQSYVENECYMQAIHLYVDVYIKNVFLVLKMNVEKLEARLCNSVRSNMLGEIDYFIFLDIGRKRREERNVFDQAMVDSFENILKKNHVTKPSDIVPSDKYPTENILMFWEGCCNRILNESPCDLYDEEELEEKILLLKKIIERKPKALYREWLSKLELDRDYAEIIKLYGKKEWITDKIIADEILLENDENIMSSYDELCGLSMQQILENEKKVSAFQHVFAVCKKEYVKQVNEQMGSRIRHSILDTEFVQLLKKFSLFFPLCNVQEKNAIFELNPYISILPLAEKESMYDRLQKCCLKLFEDINLAKKELIFFTHKEKDKEYTSMYITLDELKQYIQRIEDISNEARFVSAIKDILDNILIDRLNILREKLKRRLIDVQEEYIMNVKSIVDNEHLHVSILDLQEEMEKLINKIVAWFNLFSNGEQECDLIVYLDEQKQVYSDFQFDFIISKNSQTNVKLKIIRDIDMILKNLIRNIQLHSGHVTNLCDAKAQFTICLDENSHFLLETSNHIILKEDKKYLDEKINEINNRTNVGKPSADFGVIDGEGRGYKSINSVIQKRYYNSKLNVSVENNVFKARIEFDVERK